MYHDVLLALYLTIMLYILISGRSRPVANSMSCRVHEIPTSTEMPSFTTPVRLEHQFGLLQCVANIAGIIARTGTYVAPTGIFLRMSTPGLALILWPIGGAISLLSSLVFSKPGTTYPKCSEAYLYLRMLLQCVCHKSCSQIGATD